MIRFFRASNRLSPNYRMRSMELRFCGRDYARRTAILTKLARQEYELPICGIEFIEFIDHCFVGMLEEEFMQSIRSEIVRRAENAVPSQGFGKQT